MCVEWRKFNVLFTTERLCPCSMMASLIVCTRTSGHRGQVEKVKLKKLHNSYVQCIYILKCYIISTSNICLVTILRKYLSVTIILCSMQNRPFPTEEDLASIDEEALKKAAEESEKEKEEEEEEWIGEIQLSTIICLLKNQQKSINIFFKCKVRSYYQDTVRRQDKVSRLYFYRILNVI